METQPPFDFNLGLKKLNELIKGIKIAMLTTVSTDLTLHSSPLLTQEIEFDGDLWFLISKNSHKAQYLRNNHNVCISYAAGAKYVSITGTAEFWEGHSMPVMSVLEFMNATTGSHIKMGEHGELNLKQ